MRSNRISYRVVEDLAEPPNQDAVINISLPIEKNRNTKQIIHYLFGLAMIVIMALVIGKVSLGDSLTQSNLSKPMTKNKRTIDENGTCPKNQSLITFDWDMTSYSTLPKTEEGLFGLVFQTQKPWTFLLGISWVELRAKNGPTGRTIFFWEMDDHGNMVPVEEMEFQINNHSQSVVVFSFKTPIPLTENRSYGVSFMGPIGHKDDHHIYPISQKTKFPIKTDDLIGLGSFRLKVPDQIYQPIFLSRDMHFFINVIICCNHTN